MNVLATLKAAAQAKLAGVHADVVTYIAELEASLKTNRYYVMGGSVIGLIVGGFLDHWLKK